MKRMFLSKHSGTSIIEPLLTEEHFFSDVFVFTDAQGWLEIIFWLTLFLYKL